jgi:predicted Zn finger-like uncharacterized protein
MSIEGNCPACEATFKVEDKFAGRRAKCAKCSTVFVIPTFLEKMQPPIPEPPQTGPLATERQKEYARSLGVSFDEGIDRRTISKLIDSAVQAQQDERQRELDELQSREGEAYLKLREEIENELDEDNPRVSNATAQQMADALGEAGTAAILLTFDPDVLDEEGAILGNVSVCWSECLLEHDDAMSVLKQMGSKLLIDDNPALRKMLQE